MGEEFSNQNSESQNDESPWLSRTNGAEVEIKGEPGCSPERLDTYIEVSRAFVESSEDDLGKRIWRAVSVSGDTKLRREAVREFRGKPGSYKAKTVAGVMMSFLIWFQRSEDLVIRFPDFEMKAPSSYDERAVLKRYGRTCDFERGALEACRRSGDELYTTMLTLSASRENANGEPRCPADLTHQIRGSWRNNVRRELQRVFEPIGADRFNRGNPPDKWWEYARIAEPHDSGYAHHHIAVFTNFEVTTKSFEPVIARHVETTPSASWSAHQIRPDNPKKSSVSVNRVDPKRTADGDVVGNLASYLSGYLSEFNEDGEWVPVLEKPPHEVMFLSIAWAMQLRRYDFSDGGHELRLLGKEVRPEEYRKREQEGEIPAPYAIGDTSTGKEFPIDEPSVIEMVNVIDEPELDPEKVFR